MAKVVTVTRKIEFYPIGDNRLDFYSFFQKHARLQTVAKQLAYNKSMEVNIVSNSINKVEKLYEEDLANLNNSINNDFELIKGLDKSDKKYDAKLKKLNQSIEKNKNKRNNILSKKSIESRKTLEKALGQKESKIIDDMVMMTEDESGVKLKDLADQNTYLYTGTYNAKQDFKNDVKNGLLYGKVSPRTYGTFDILDVLMSSMHQARNIRKEGQHYLFTMHGFELKVNLGSKPRLATMTKQALDDVISENVVKVCDSKIQKVGKKFFLLLVLQIEVEQPVLDQDKIMGIDLGMDIPAYVAMDFNPEIGRAFGDKKELLSFKTKIQKLKDLEKHRSIYARSGHGRKRKLKNNHLEALSKRESNFSKTYNHTISKKIVEYAVKFKIGTIRMERLDSKGFKNTKVLGQWTYYMLQTMIETKADSMGIKVEYVNPAYTSKTCSRCGHVKENYELGNRDGDDGRQFHCPNCGNKMNCDHNAAVNIAGGGVEIPKNFSISS